MRTVSVREHDREDLTRRAQIIDAAILAFAQEGARASVRTIAAAAGVSPGLITHHFGSKNALKQACDAEVLARYTDLKLGGVTNPLGAIDQIVDDSGAISVMTCYMIRSFIDGGDLAHRFFEQLVARMRTITDAARERGLIKPSRHEEARMTYLATAAFGSAVVSFILNPPADVTRAFRAAGVDAESLLAQVEVMTTGIFADSTYLDALERRLGTADATPTAQPQSGHTTTGNYHGEETHA